MTFKRLSILLVVALLALNACSSSEEKQAKAQLGQAQALEAQKDLPAARALLEELVQKYPETDAAKEALVVQQRIITRMDGVQRELRKTLESLVLVIAGYQSMTGRQLAELADLDEGGYMFGTDYLAEAVPAGVDAYILLDGQGGFKLWAYNAEFRMGMKRDSLHPVATAFAADAPVEQLLKDYRSEKVADNVTNLLAMVTAGK